MYFPVTADYDFYISTTGSDSNDGSFASPWAITALNTKTATYAGMSVGILDGEWNLYDELVAHGSDYDAAVFMIPSGTEGSPTVIASVNPRLAIFNGSDGVNFGNTVGGSAMFGTGSGGYVTFDGLAICGSNRWGIRAGIPYDTGRARIQDITVKNCEFYNFNGANLADNGGVNVNVLELNQCEGFLIQNNYFHDSQGFGPADADHWSAIETWQCINGIVEYNTSVLSGAFDGKLGAANGNIFRYNYLDCSHLTSGFNGCFRAWGSESSGAPEWGTAEDDFHNNILIGTSALNLLDYGTSTEYTPHPVTVRNNTLIVTSGGAASFGFLARVTPGGLKFYNNIVTSAASGDQSFIAVNINANGLIDFNSYYRASGSNVWQTYATHSATPTNTRGDASPLSAWQTAMGANSSGGAGADEHSTSGENPGFTLSGTLADRYQLSSPNSAGRSDGTGTGTVCAIGAWGGLVTPSRIGFSTGVRM